MGKVQRSAHEAYSKGEYSNKLMEPYPQETSLIFKLQQRKNPAIRSLAEHVVRQLSPNDGQPEETIDGDYLRNEISRYFKLGKESRISEDMTLFRVSPDKKLVVHVQAMRNLPSKGKLETDSSRPLRVVRALRFERGHQLQSRWKAVHALRHAIGSVESDRNGRGTRVQ